MIECLVEPRREYHVWAGIDSREDLALYISDLERKGEYLCCKTARDFTGSDRVWKCDVYCPFPSCFKEEIRKNRLPPILAKLKAEYRPPDLSKIAVTPPDDQDWKSSKHQITSIKKAECSRLRVQPRIEELKKVGVPGDLISIICKWNPERTSQFLKYNSEAIADYVSKKQSARDKHYQGLREIASQRRMSSDCNPMDGFPLSSDMGVSGSISKVKRKLELAKCRRQRLLAWIRGLEASQPV